MIIKRIVVGPLETNCFLFGCEKTKKCAVIDPGDQPQKIIKAIKDEGLDAEWIILTHGHFDHILGAASVKNSTGAKIACHEYTEKSLESDNESLASSVSLTGEKCSPDRYLKEGDVIKVGDLALDVIETPGHMLGSICLLADGVMFAGDTIFLENCGRCDLPGGNYSDMLKTLMRIGEMPGDFDIHCGHGPSTTLSHEQKFNPYMREGMR